MAVRVRELTEAERTELERRAHARTAPARVVERARLVLAAQAGDHAPAVAGRLGVAAGTVRLWVRRFNAAGLPGLEDRPRSGRPETYTAEQVGAVIAAALTEPRALGLPFACWTLDRLTAYLRERPPEAGGPLPISRSQIDRLLAEVGLRWRKQETWLGEPVDPDFAAQRVQSSGSGPGRRRTASWSTSTRWGRRAPAAAPA